MKDLVKYLRKGFDSRYDINLDELNERMNEAADKIEDLWHDRRHLTGSLIFISKIKNTNFFTPWHIYADWLQSIAKDTVRHHVFRMMNRHYSRKDK